VSTHLNDHQLLAYVEDDLPPSQRERAEAHLSDCPACRARLERLEETATRLTTALRATGKQIPMAPARSWEAVSKRLAKNPRPARLVAAFRPRLRYAATLAALAVLVAGIAGLAHTLAVNISEPEESTPTPRPTPAASPSFPPGLLPGQHQSRTTSQTSLLILGIDGEHASSSETDMLMLLYLDHEAKHAFLLSIPRDLYVEVDGHGLARVGSVYGIGEKESTDSLALARETISATLGLPVDHAVLVRFESFVTLIDAIGGMDVDVLYAIDDAHFPDGRGGYASFSIPAGQQHLDGALALRYARTRAVPAPGFDRAFRQRQIVLAAQERVTRLDLLPDLIAQSPTLWTTISGSLETDLSLSEAIELALLTPGISADDIATASLDACCTVEYVTRAGEQVLLPQAEAIEALIQDLLEEK
jgi:LCP family protein required for cell wall assembly